MNILTIKEDRIEVTINVDHITYMEFSDSKDETDNMMRLHFTQGQVLEFTGESARHIQWEVDMIMAKVSGETAIVEVMSNREHLAGEKANAGEELDDDEIDGIRVHV